MKKRNSFPRELHISWETIRLNYDRTLFRWIPAISLLSVKHVKKCLNCKVYNVFSPAKCAKSLQLHSAIKDMERGGVFKNGTLNKKN